MDDMTVVALGSMNDCCTVVITWRVARTDISL